LNEHTKIGDPFNIKLTLQRKEGSNGALHADVHIHVTAVSYAGRRQAKPLKDSKGTVNIPVSSNQSGALTATISTNEYLSLFKQDYHFLSVRAFVSIKETQQLTLLERNFMFENNPVVLSYLGTLMGLRVGTTGKVRATWVNPLKTPLNNVVLKVEGQGLTKVQTFNIGRLGGEATLDQIFEITALEEQNHFLIASISSTELGNINGHIELLVLKA